MFTIGFFNKEQETQKQIGFCQPGHCLRQK